VIPLSVILLPFIDVWVTGPEKAIEKRPLMFWITVMGFLNWVVFSVLIIVNIANIHNDPPYWRDFLWLMINVGMVLQLMVFAKEKNPITRINNAKGALTMGIFAAIQSLLAFIYFFMAKTDLFLSPITQAFTYWVYRCVGAVPQADALETALAKLAPVKDYTASGYFLDFLPYVKERFLPKGGAEMHQAYDQVTQLCQQSSWLDWTVNWIPTFTPYHPHYQGVVDYMVSNRWAYDYVVFCFRMNVKQTPTYVGQFQVPSLDWGWMIVAPLVTVACFWMYAKLKAEKAAKADAQKPAAAAAS
jgi:hypothetical protein